jgi:hypothetical protein
VRDAEKRMKKSLATVSNPRHPQTPTRTTRLPLTASRQPASSSQRCGEASQSLPQTDTSVLT